MMKEIEVKILNIDKEKIKLLLNKLGARQILQPTLFKEFYFESPIENATYSAFRLRAEGDKNFLTVKLKKENNENFQIRDEYEVEVASFEKTLEIVLLLGFKVFRKREKIRESFKLNNVKIEFDQYPKVDVYMELEASKIEDIQEALETLGFSMEDTTNKTGTEIIRDAGANPDDLFFADRSL